MLGLRTRFACMLAALAAGCPEDEPAARQESRTQSATHAGLISIQDISIAGAPQAGHGLTVQAFFTAARPADFEEQRRNVFGCKVMAYDVEREPGPVESDQGPLRIDGIQGGQISCVFAAGRGYVCPTTSGSATVQVNTDAGASSYALEGVTLTAADVGRYLQVAGASSAQNNGAFAILGVAAEGSVVVANPAAVAESFAGTYTVVAGAGPTPRDLYSPFRADSQVRVALERGGGKDFDAFEVEIEPGSALVPDRDTLERLRQIDPQAGELSLSCEGEGGDCGTAAVTIVRINTTDGDIAGLPPSAMPRPRKRAVEIQCAEADTGTLHVPAAALAYLRDAHVASPITRIRTAFMRDGYAFASNGAGKPDNRTIIVAGHGVIGFTNPQN